MNAEQVCACVAMMFLTARNYYRCECELMTGGDRDRDRCTEAIQVPISGRGQMDDKWTLYKCSASIEQSFVVWDSLMLMPTFACILLLA